MRIFAYFIVFSLLLNLGFIGKVLAETSINVSNNDENSKTNVSVTTNTGENTICTNGKCTTASNEGESKSTVCINGKCYTSNDGNLNIEEGGSKVSISNSVEKDSISATVTPNTTVMKKFEDSKASLEAKKKELKEILQQGLEQRHFDIGQIIRGLTKFFLSWLF